MVLVSIHCLHHSTYPTALLSPGGNCLVELPQNEKIPNLVELQERPASRIPELTATLSLSFSDRAGQFLESDVSLARAGSVNRRCRLSGVDRPRLPRGGKQTVQFGAGGPINGRTVRIKASALPKNASLTPVRRHRSRSSIGTGPRGGLKGLAACYRQWVGGRCQLQPSTTTRSRQLHSRELSNPIFDLCRYGLYK